jgi:hypothetical protein
MQPFVLTSDAASLRGEGTRVVEVPMSLLDKAAVMRWYAAALELPDYFGANWDALDECLCDLSWIDDRRVVLYHRTIPLKARSQDQKIYIELLAHAVGERKPGEPPELAVAFDPVCEMKLRAVMCPP